MHLTGFVAALMLSLSASAAPTENAKAAVSGSNTNGSIFRFGSASQCHEILRTAGACGISTYFKGVNSKSSFVAMPAEIFDKHGQSQHNTLCGKTITLTHNGVTKKGVVADRNLSNDHSIDMCLDLWQAFGGHDNDGTLIKGITWSIQD